MPTSSQAISPKGKKQEEIKAKQGRTTLRARRDRQGEGRREGEAERVRRPVVDTIRTDNSCMRLGKGWSGLGRMMQIEVGRGRGEPDGGRIGQGKSAGVGKREKVGGSNGK